MSLESPDICCAGHEEEERCELLVREAYIERETKQYISICLEIFTVWIKSSMNP